MAERMATISGRISTDRHNLSTAHGGNDMRTLLIALAALCMCGCSSQGTPGSAPIGKDPAPAVAWSKMPSYFKCDFDSHVFSTEAEGGGSFVPKIHHYPLAHDSLI